MAIVVTVNIDADLASVEKAEQEIPEVMQVIGTAAARHMTGHRRTARDGHVMDLDEFASKDDYDAFFAEAGEAVRKYGEAVGVAPRDTLWTIQDAS